MYKQDLALNNQQWLICHKTKPLMILSCHIQSFKFSSFKQKLFSLSGSDFYAKITTIYDLH